MWTNFCPFDKTGNCKCRSIQWCLNTGSAFWYTTNFTPYNSMSPLKKLKLLICTILNRKNQIILHVYTSRGRIIQSSSWLRCNLDNWLRLVAVACYPHIFVSILLLPESYRSAEVSSLTLLAKASQTNPACVSTIPAKRTGSEITYSFHQKKIWFHT